MFLFSAKNSAGLFCCKMSAFLDIAELLRGQGKLPSCHMFYMKGEATVLCMDEVAISMCMTQDSPLTTYAKHSDALPSTAD